MAKKMVYKGGLKKGPRKVPDPRYKGNPFDRSPKKVPNPKGKLPKPGPKRVKPMKKKSTSIFDS